MASDIIEHLISRICSCLPFLETIPSGIQQRGDFNGMQRCIAQQNSKNTPNFHYVSLNIFTSVMLCCECPEKVNLGGLIPYFFDYKTGVFSFQNNPKDLDPSCKMDLDLWDCLGMGKIGIIARFHRTDLVT